MLKNKLQDDLHQALKEKNDMKVSVLRMVISEVKNKEIDLHGDADDGVIRSCIQKQKKQLEDTIPLFEKAGRNDLATNYQAQVEILSSYLPQQLAPEELRVQLESFINSSDLKALPEVAIIGRAIGAFKDVADANTVRSMVLELRAT
jgi:uncharacterized protein